LNKKNYSTISNKPSTKAKMKLRGLAFYDPARSDLKPHDNEFVSWISHVNTLQVDLVWFGPGTWKVPTFVAWCIKYFDLDPATAAMTRMYTDDTTPDSQILADTSLGTGAEIIRAKQFWLSLRRAPVMLTDSSWLADYARSMFRIKVFKWVQQWMALNLVVNAADVYRRHESLLYPDHGRFFDDSFVSKAHPIQLQTYLLLSVRPQRRAISVCVTDACLCG
jgi:hypothetical protein